MLSKRKGSICSLFLLLLVGCTGVRYRYAIEDSSLPTAYVSVDGVYSDSLLATSIVAIENEAHSLIGFRLKLENRSKEAFTVVLDQARLVDPQEHQLPLMRGVSEPCQPLRLAAGARIEETLFPAKNLQRNTDRIGRFLGLEFRPMIEWFDESWDLAKIGLLLPVQVGEGTKNYSLVIRVKRD